MRISFISPVVPDLAVAIEAEQGLETMVADTASRAAKAPIRSTLKPWNQVMYPSGTVETGLHRDIAASVTREVSGVSRVVNDVAIEK